MDVPTSCRVTIYIYIYIVRRLCAHPTILPRYLNGSPQDCKVARGVLGQYCGLPLRYLGNIAGGARNLCILYIHHAGYGHIHSMCLRYLYGGLMDGIHNMVCTLCEHVHISAACARLFGFHCINVNIVL